jgi:sigma-B regulation protein RsbU (phosphoserine phosphatase)
MTIDLESLKESNEFLNLLLDNLTSAVFVVDQDLRLYAFNDGFCKLFAKGERDVMHQLCGNAMNCQFAVDEQALCGETSNCTSCELRDSVFSAFTNRVPTYKSKLTRNFYVGSQAMKKHFLFSTVHVPYSGRSMILVIVDDVSEIETQRIILAERQSRLEEDLAAAAGIQQSLLPAGFPAGGHWEFGSYFLPSEHVGGDIFNVFALDAHRFVAYVIDVSGHGVPAALVTVSVNQMLNPTTGYFSRDNAEADRQLRGLASPAVVLERLDHEYPIERFDKYFTISYAVLHSTGTVLYSGAGHPPPILVRTDGSLDFLDQGGAIIGMGGIVPFEEAEANVRPGDRILLYTDGLTEHANPQGEMFGVDRLTECLRQVRTAPVHQVAKAIMAAALDFAGPVKPEDDVSILVAQFKG